MHFFIFFGFFQGPLNKATSLALPLRLFLDHLNDSSPTSWTYLEDELFLPLRKELRSQVPTYVSMNCFTSYILVTAVKELKKIIYMYIFFYIYIYIVCNLFVLQRSWFLLFIYLFILFSYLFNNILHSFLKTCIFAFKIFLLEIPLTDQVGSHSDRYYIGLFLVPASTPRLV